jgi:hypothetical protein
MTSVTVGSETYSIHPKLKEKWDIIKDKLIERDEDRVYCVDGRERVGKSVFALQQAAYLDPTLITDMKRICFTANEFLEAIRTAKPGQVIIFDEAFRGLSSRGALSKTNRTIVQALMEMGQKNLIVFIVLPSFFMLDLYAAMLRSNSLFHIAKEKNSNRRYFKVYNYKKKAKLYQNGVKKGWEYKVPSKFKGNFFNKYPGGKEFEMKYREKKRLSLESMETTTGNDGGLTNNFQQAGIKVGERVLEALERVGSYGKLAKESGQPKTTLHNYAKMALKARKQLEMVAVPSSII